MGNTLNLDMTQTLYAEMSLDTTIDELEFGSLDIVELCLFLEELLEFDITRQDMSVIENKVESAKTLRDILNAYLEANK